MVYTCWVGGLRLCAGVELCRARWYYMYTVSMLDHLLAPGNQGDVVGLWHVMVVLLLRE